MHSYTLSWSYCHTDSGYKDRGVVTFKQISSSNLDDWWSHNALCSPSYVCGNNTVLMLRFVPDFCATYNIEQNNNHGQPKLSMLRNKLFLKDFVWDIYPNPEIWRKRCLQVFSMSLVVVKRSCKANCFKFRSLDLLWSYVPVAFGHLHLPAKKFSVL